MHFSSDENFEKFFLSLTNKFIFSSAANLKKDLNDYNWHDEVISFDLC